MPSDAMPNGLMSSRLLINEMDYEAAFLLNEIEMFSKSTAFGPIHARMLFLQFTKKKTSQTKKTSLHLFSIFLYFYWMPKQITSIDSFVGIEHRPHSLINAYAELAFGPRRRPKPCTTLTKRRLYWMRRLARPVFFFFFSCFSTFGVCPLTLPARANEPWTLPPNKPTFMSNS